MKIVLYKSNNADNGHMPIEVLEKATSGGLYPLNYPSCRWGLLLKTLYQYPETGKITEAEILNLEKAGTGHLREGNVFYFVDRVSLKPFKCIVEDVNISIPWKIEKDNEGNEQIVYFPLKVLDKSANYCEW